MASVDDLLAVLQVTRESLPHDAVDEDAVIAAIAQAREDGSAQIRNCLAKLDALIGTAGSQW